MSIHDKLVKINDQINEIQKDMDDINGLLGNYDYNRNIHNIILGMLSKSQNSLEAFNQHIFIIKSLNDLEVLNGRLST